MIRWVRKIDEESASRNVLITQSRSEFRAVCIRPNSVTIEQYVLVWRATTELIRIGFEISKFIFKLEKMNQQDKHVLSNWAWPIFSSSYEFLGLLL